MTSDLSKIEAIEAAWADEIARRIRQIDTGEVTPIPSDIAFRTVRKKLNESRGPS